jgi:hypothetical protein
MDPFHTLCLRRHGEQWSPPEALLCLDPGDTLGWALFRQGRLADWGQIPGSFKDLKDLLFIQEPTLILYEEFRLYPWMAKQQSFSDIPTLRLIGALESLCEDLGIPTLKQSAQEGKGHVTDEKLKDWHYYQVHKRHANDAIRHGCHALLFKALPPLTAAA